MIEHTERDLYDFSTQTGFMGHQQEPFSYQKVNTRTIPYTLASFCVIKQSWRCFVRLIEARGLSELQSTINQPESFDKAQNRKLPKDFAEENDLSSEYEQIVAWFELYRPSNGAHLK